MTFRKLSCSALAILMLLSALPIISATYPPPSVPPPDPVAMWILNATGFVNINLTTANATHTYGYRFNVTVWAKTNQTTKGWQFWMIYDGTILNATGAWYCLPNGLGDPLGPSEFMVGTGATMPVTPAFTLLYNGTHSRVEFGEAWSGGAFTPAKPAGARCAIVEFNVTDVPDKGIIPLETIIDIQEAQPAGQTYILNSATPAVKIAYLAPYDALYGFKWANPPNPDLALDPATRFYNRYTIWNGTLFEESAYVSSLAAAWYLVNVSFTLNYPAAELEIADIEKNVPGAWDVAFNADNTTTVGQVVVYAETSKTLSGNVWVCNITFRILDQELYPTVEVHSLTFTNVKMYDHTLEITPTIVPGAITVEGYLAVAMPWMEVVPKDTIMGSEHGECVKGDTFQVRVNITRLHFAWKLVGLEFRLRYPNDLLEVVNVEEGPYMKDPAWNKYGTWFISFNETDGWGHHVLVGNMLLPAPNGTWLYFPGAVPGNSKENGTIAIITFRIIHQTIFYPAAILDTGNLDLFRIRMADNKAHLIPVDFDRVVNGTYKCWSGIQQGRFIDVYGGAENRGYGTAHGYPYYPGPSDGGVIFPDPYGGQGYHRNMDLVIPQSVVYLFANVTYNFWPTQHKDVGFEIEGPFEQEGWTPEQPEPKPAPPFHVRKYSNTTDELGVAWIKFQMQWPCVNPEDYFGKYRVTVSVDICGEVVHDVLWFDYYYLVEITKVTTDKYYYIHCEHVWITIDFRSKAHLRYPVLFAIVIQDELETHFGYSWIWTIVEDAEFCHWKCYREITEIHIPKWAFAGFAKIYVSAFDRDPTDCGAPWCPTYGLGWPPGSVLPEIYIEPR